VSIAVVLENVSFGYRPGQRVLEGVDLRLGQGEFVAVAGPNGGGKTTLVRILLGLERPSEGRALLYGEPAHRFSRRRTSAISRSASARGSAGHRA
jgi:ABC-type Mn2+/Zn2+ transport system ATPase subunit